jgi:DNA-binding IclR family transcriptional regulator
MSEDAHEKMIAAEVYKESARGDDNSEEKMTQPAIEYLQKLQEIAGSPVSRIFAGQILSYLKQGIDSFSANELTHDLGISRKSANNFLRKFNEKGIISMSRKIGSVKYYSIVQDNCLIDMTMISERYPMLIQYTEEPGTIRKVVANVLMDNIRSRKLTLTARDLSEQTGMNSKQLHNALRPFFNMGLLTQSSYSPDGRKCYLINVGDVKKEQTEVSSAEQYSPEILRMIKELECSPLSPKDHRIARIIRSCLAKGTVTKEDYSAAGEQTRWKVDTRFAEQLGLLEKVSSSEYRIVKEIKGDAGTKLRSGQKSTLSALYDIFGDGMFSAEMVVAQLDYSSAKASGMLHQFTMMKLLDCSKNEDKSYSYQLNVNPADNPECFAEAV